jgi:hypothetical protein
MSHAFSFHPDQHLIVGRYIGRTTIQDMRDLAAEIWSHPNYNPTHCGIIDYRDAEMDISPAGIREICEFFAESSQASRGRFSILVNRPLETGLNTLFMLRMETRNTMQMFSTWDAACRFLGVSLPDPIAR